MTAILGVGLVGTAILATIDLLLVLGLSRRLRLGDFGGPSAERVVTPAAGTEVPTFELETLDGSVVTDANVRTGTVLLAFLAEGCVPCASLAVELKNAPPREPLVVFASGEGTLEFISELRDFQDFATVVFLGRDTATTRAFGVTAVPTVVRVVDGVVKATGRHVETSLT